MLVMNEAQGVSVDASANASEDAALKAAMDACRVESVPLYDPVGWAYVEALASRWSVAAESVRPVLRSRLDVAVQAARARVRDRVAVAAPTGTRARKPAAKPECERASQGVQSLRQLNRSSAAAAQDTPGSRPELRSARRFHEMWARLMAEEELDQAFGRAPENAGPLNPHMLVLKTLQQMREFSPEYLRRFVTQAESLLWLSEVPARLRQPASGSRGVKGAKGKPASRSRRKG